jgi:hypothetical protein
MEDWIVRKINELVKDPCSASDVSKQGRMMFKFADRKLHLNKQNKHDDVNLLVCNNT